MAGAPGDVYVLPASVASVVSFYGSFMCAPDFTQDEEMLRDIVISMLDKGTRSRSKLEIASSIESTGASLSFSHAGLRGGISGKVLTKDLAQIMSLMREQLVEPAFPEDELDLVKEQYKASIQRSMLDTGARASAALSRSIFSNHHPNYASHPEEELSLLESISVEDVREYFRTKMKLSDFRMAFVGDVSVSDLARSGLSELDVAGDSGLEKWEIVGPSPAPIPRIEIPVPDRDNLDVQIGHGVALDRSDPDFLPLSLGIFIVGGNFSSRLMQVVRDEKGLTYGVRSSMGGIDRYYSGMWKTTIALSGDKLEEGIDATLNQLQHFIAKGVSKTEVAEKAETIAGSFGVGLSTTGSLARSIVSLRQRGEDLAYLDEYATKVRATTADDVNRVIRKYLDADALTVAVSGTFPE